MRPPVLRRDAGGVPPDRSRPLYAQSSFALIEASQLSAAEIADFYEQIGRTMWVSRFPAPAA